MKNFIKTIFILLLTCSISNGLRAQSSFFNDANEQSINMQKGSSERDIIPLKYRTVKLDNEAFVSFLKSLPAEKNMLNRKSTPVLYLPMPDGSIAQFHVWESSIMEPDLQEKYPEIRTFAGQGITDPFATIRFDYNPYSGFHAQVLSAATGRIFIDPYVKGDIEHYNSFFAKDFLKKDNFVCLTESTAERAVQQITTPGFCRGTELFTYRLALACTGEYAQAVGGGTVAGSLAAMVTAMNRVNGVYETEVSVRMILIANNNLIVYTNGATDPYSNDDGYAMLDENQTNVDAVIGSANYDIGHVFSTGGGGVAFLKSPCTNFKAGGVTGLPNPIGDPFYIDYVAHEMGHQWGGNHTFNSQMGSCGGNRNTSTAYEIGSGTSIQAYAGICGDDDTQLNSDPFFHTISIDEISNFINFGAGGCGVNTATGNTLPVITAMNNNGVNIPISTPFTLTGTATDADNDALTYSWEQWDLGPSTAWNGGNANTTSPLFKSRVPKTTGSRTFPDINVILAGYPANPPPDLGGLKGETLPTVARALKFRLTVRDNRAGGGGVVTGGEGCQIGMTNTFQINTIATSGPFAVTLPNGGESWDGGSTKQITWNVVGTDLTPINCANVKISLSTDGGFTYPTVLIASTPNDGTENLLIPNIATTMARIKVEAVGNIFFDIGNANFTINQVNLLTINDVTQNEGNAGTSTFTFTVSLSEPAGAGGVTFDIATQDNTATTSDNDYVAKSLTAQTIPAGSSTYTFDVLVNGDIVSESNETFFVNVTNVIGATLSDAGSG
ncbi:MAG: hypothetical protein IPO45_06645 [Saprospiraceae bacterium]|nr:hypothetical protein [Candidatus Brachybacter algidus]